MKSLRTNRPVYPEVTEHLRDGLRAAVNTYAHIRQWADIRNPRPDVDPGPIEWTEDDQILLNDSMMGVTGRDLLGPYTDDPNPGFGTVWKPAIHRDVENPS